MTAEIIAELAQGFEGRYQQALLLLKAAAKAGANAAKFQLVFADELATPDYVHYELFKTLEMESSEWKSLFDFSIKNQIELQVDIFGDKSLKLAESIGIKTVKIHCTDINNIDLLLNLASSKIGRILLGVGGAHEQEIRNALDILKEKNIVLLLGFQGYPTATEDNQITRVQLFRELYQKPGNHNIQIGFADHATPDSHLSYAIAATALGAGATVIEKHLTLGQVMELEDFESALNPDQFSEFVSTIHGCMTAMGSCNNQHDFGMSNQESVYREKVRRHVVAKTDLEKGKKLGPKDLVFKRTSSQDYISDIQSVYEKILTKNVNANSPITSTMLTNP